MTTNQRRVHFLVCIKDEELVETLKHLCIEYAIIPDFIYRRYVICCGAPMPVCSRDLDALVKLPGSMDYPTYMQHSKKGCNLFSDVAFASVDPIVSCVRLHTNWTQLFGLLLVPQAFTRTLVLYHPEAEKREQQKKMFSTLPLRHLKKPISLVDAPEQIFEHLGVDVLVA